MKKLQIYEENKSYYKMQLESIQKRLDKIEKFKKKTYESYMDDTISREDYVQYVSDYENEARQLQKQQSEIQNKLDLEKELNDQYDEWTEDFKNYIGIEKLTREVVLELIDKVEVNKDGSITIFYKFRNPYV